MDAMARHQCMIYEGSPAKHLTGLAHLISERLRAKNRCLYLNSPPMVAGIRSYLAATGLNVAEQVAKGALVLSSDLQHLVNLRFDADRLLKMVADAIRASLADGYSGLWATGDMTWELGGEVNVEKLMEYERGLEEMFRSNPGLSGVCQYHQDTLPEEFLQGAVYHHRAVYVNETLSRMNPYYSESPATHRWSTPEIKEMIIQLTRP